MKNYTRTLLILLCAVACCGGRAAADGDVVGKVVAGYQGWFACAGDGTPFGDLNRWVHWSNSTAPAPGHQTFELWPDVREFGPEHTYPTGYASLGNGQPARLFSSDQKFTVDTHTPVDAPVRNRLRRAPEVWGWVDRPGLCTTL